MANSLSSRKRIRQNQRDRERNRVRKAVVKSQTRRFLDAIHDGKVDVAKEAFVSVQKTLDQVAAKKTLHRNTVARRKSRLVKRLNALAAGKTS